MDVRLRPIRDDEFPAFYAGSKRGFREDLERHGGWEPEIAQTKAEENYDDFFPDAVPAEGHHVFVIEADGERAGVLWIIWPRDEPGVAFLADIDVDAELRGRGIGRAAMHAFEDKARELGATSTMLNVFGANDVARGLYASLGYTERSVNMAKRL
jgi:Acetyltransferase (GNAT) family.